MGSLAEMTQLVFGFPQGHGLSEYAASFLVRHSQAGAFIQAVFPLPMPWAGNLNFI